MRARRLTWRALRDDLLGVRDLRETRYGLTPVMVLMFLTFCQRFDSAIFGALLPEIRRELDVSIGTIGAVSSVAGFVALASTPFAGYVTDRAHRVRLLAVSSVLSGVFSLVSGSARGIGQIFAARAVDDISENFGGVPRLALTYDYYPVEARGKMVAFQQAVGDALALSIGPMVGALALVGGWRLPFFIAGPLLIVAGVVCLVTLREPVRGYWERRHLGASEEVADQADPPIGLAESVRTIMAVRTLRRQVIGRLLGVLATRSYLFLFPFYLSSQFGLNTLERALVFTLPSVAAIAATVAGGTLADTLLKRRPSRVIVLQGTVGLLASATLLCIAAFPSLWVLVGLMTVLSIINGLVEPASEVVAANVLPPRLRGLGVSLIQTVVIAIALMAPGLAGSFADSYGLRGAMLSLAPLTIIGPLVFISSAKFFDFDMRAAFASAMAKEEYRKAKQAGEVQLLVAKDVDVSYGSVQVLFNVDLTVSEGEIVALLGTNGAGKSTLLRAVAGTQEASNGAILFDGRDITHVPPAEIAKLGIAVMPGGKGTFPGLTVRENLELALWNCPADESQSRLRQVYDFFPVLEERLDQDAALLSGGEQQMVALGQAFCSSPRLLMIDELSLGLSPAVVGRLLDIVRAIREQGTTVILVEQSVNVALTIADRAVFMEKGEVRFEGSTAELLSRPELMRAVYVKGAAALTESAPASTRSSTKSGQPRLEVEGVAKAYGGRVAVADVSFTLHEGEALGFIGPNGAGKTTLFDLLSGYQPADSGKVLLDGVEVTGRSADSRARAGLIRRFQDARLFGPLTVFETICVALEQKAEVRSTLLIAAQLPSARRSEQRVRRAADRLIDMFELGDYRNSFVSDLSTGLRRVVDLACVLAAEPKVLLLDEPSSGLAQAESESLGPLLRRVRHETGCSLLIIEHDMGLVRAVSDELVGMVEGRIVAKGAAEEVLSDPLLVAGYLGEKQEAIIRQGQPVTGAR